MLSEGATAPDFQLPGTDGGLDFETYRLSEHADDGAVVLAFYPFDFSPVCTRELCDFRDAEWFTVADDVDVFGISRDACYAHARFIDDHHLTFPLLSDVEGTATEAYDVKYDEFEGHPGVPRRAVFVVDATRTVRYAWGSEDAYASPDLQDLADALAALPTVDADPGDLG
ncbi:MAG: redoxin domain-containing protein [Haloarculaceae archaeon]